MAKERTFGYHPTEEPRIFEIDRDAGETLPEGWVDTPAKLAPKSAETADLPVRVAAPEAGKANDAARIDELTAELAALKDMVKALQRPAPKPRKRRRRAGKRRAQREAAAAGAAPQGSE